MIKKYYHYILFFLEFIFLDINRCCVMQLIIIALLLSTINIYIYTF